MAPTRRARSKPQASQRPGPRPLPLHVSLQTLTWVSSLGALPHLKNGSLAWSPELAEEAEALRSSLAGVEPERLRDAVDAEARRRLADFAAGVTAYRHHPSRRRLADPPTLWSEGSCRLLDYGATENGAGRPLVVVPSLINRAYVLDLSRKRSLLRYLALRGFRPLLMDWGTPGGRELGFDLSDYIAGRLESALQATLNHCGRPAGVIGYCMGGLLALALAQRRPEDVGALALLATPWDFHAVGPPHIRWLKATTPGIDALLNAVGHLPVDVLQAMFASLDPFATAAKFRRFAALDPRSERARDFVRLEDWLNDGVPLAAPVARECLVDWYVENAPAEGRWSVRGKPVRPEDITTPTLVVIPQSDHIVPPSSALPLAEALPRAETLALPSGHIGMVAGRRAVTSLYRPLARWFAQAL